ncbi:hypothetical protein EDB94_2788 [Marinobacter sp. 3-2]|jgi:predicted RNase H-like nuclease (RuvC/YqgF family)|uniref:VPA1267 family protein n=1 Tax=Marinobacter sp. 3-2 TaxID=2485141 RepID=UPI000FB77679|nr:VPA1267 family protein [Marinobacter sp. 3-2]ROQ43332.1 hypothetical protein EDB94_2788 [Marinobacter sp. 3-2]
MGNGKTFGAANLAAFHEWSQSRTEKGDWDKFIRRGILNRTKIANDCNFGKAVFGQNPSVSRALEALETQLRKERVLPPLTQNPSKSERAFSSIAARSTESASHLERRVKTLEERCAAQQAEILKLHQKLRRYQHLDDHLGETGRLLPS